MQRAWPPVYERSFVVDAGENERTGVLLPQSALIKWAIVERCRREGIACYHCARALT